MINDNNISFEIHPPMEFLYSLFTIGTGKHFFNMIQEFDLEPNERITDITTKINSCLSSYLNQELNYFFNLPGVGYIIYKHILRNPNLTNIPEFIKTFKKIETSDFTFDIIKSVCKNSISKNKIQYEYLKEHNDKKIELVNETTFQDIKRKQLVLEILENPEESKQRLDLLLCQFYKRCFSPIESDVMNLILESKDKYKHQFENTPKEFMEQYFNFDITNTTNIIIHLSFFKYVSWHSYSLYSKELPDWFVLGIYSDELFNKDLSSEKLASFFKSISDINRIEILKLLSERPWFGQELAEKLNITPATVSYHIAFLQRIGAVTFTKSDNRSYYSLNSSKFVKTLENFTEFFRNK